MATSAQVVMLGSLVAWDYLHGPQNDTGIVISPPDADGAFIVFWARDNRASLHLLPLERENDISVIIQ